MELPITLVRSYPFLFSGKSQLSPLSPKCPPNASPNLIVRSAIIYARPIRWHLDRVLGNYMVLFLVIRSRTRDTLTKTVGTECNFYTARTLNERCLPSTGGTSHCHEYGTEGKHSQEGGFDCVETTCKNFKGSSFHEGVSKTTTSEERRCVPGIIARI